MPQLENPNLTESEKEITEQFIKAKKLGEDVGEQFGIGLIDKTTPNALFHFLCHIISYNTSTSLMEVPQMGLFEFVTELYIINKIGEKEEAAAKSPTPRGRQQHKAMGM